MQKINMATKKFKPRVNICRNEDGLLKVTKKRYLTDG